MGRTATNVAGQALVPTIVAAREKILDRGAYDAPNHGDLWSDEHPDTEQEPQPEQVTEPGQEPEPARGPAPVGT